jgi:hypothetical protein
MVSRKLGYFLFLIILVLSAKLTQSDVDDFIRSQSFLPSTATLTSFQQDSDKYVVTYKDQNTSFKFVVGQRQAGDMFLLFKEQLTHISLNSNSVNVQTPNEIMNVFAMPPIPMLNPSPLMNIMGPFQNPLIGPAQLQISPLPHWQTPSGLDRFGHRCNLNENEIKRLLK